MGWVAAAKPAKTLQWLDDGIGLFHSRIQEVFQQLDRTHFRIGNLR